MVAACSRAWWRWQHKYMQPRRSTMAPYFQLIVGSMIFFYSINYGKISKFTGSCALKQQQQQPANRSILSLHLQLHTETRSTIKHSTFQQPQLEEALSSCNNIQQI
jgi:hypothetical protein